MPDLQNPEKEEEQDNADLLYYHLFSKYYFMEPVVLFASFLLLSTRILREIETKGNIFKWFLMPYI